MEFAPHGLFLQTAAEVLDVTLHLGADEGVDAGGGEPLKLAELGKDTGTGGNEGLGEKVLGQFRDAVFVTGVEVGVEEADRDRLHASGFEFQNGGAGSVFVQGSQHFTPWVEPFGDDFAIAPFHQRACLPGNILHDGVVLRALVATNVDDVAIALGGDHAGASTVVSEQGIGGDRGAVEHVLNVAVVGLGHGTQSLDALHHANGRIVNGGGNFVNPGLLLGHIGQDQVGKGAANVYADESHTLSLRANVASDSRERRRGQNVQVARLGRSRSNLPLAGRSKPANYPSSGDDAFCETEYGDESTAYRFALCDRSRASCESHHALVLTTSWGEVQIASGRTPATMINKP